MTNDTIIYKKHKKFHKFRKKLYNALPSILCFILGGLCAFLITTYFWAKDQADDISIRYIMQDESSHTKTVICNSCYKSSFDNTEPHELDENNACTKCAYGRGLDLSKYESYVSYAGLNEDGANIAKEIVNAIHNPGEYEEVTYNDASHIVIRYPKAISEETRYRICAFFVHYFGDFKIWQKEYGGNESVAVNVFDAEILNDEDCTVVYVPSANITVLQEKRNAFVQQAETVLANIYEGSETEMLLQICDYLNTHTRYSYIANDPPYTCEEFWSDGEGYCLLYAMAFRQIAERLGISCDVVVGYSSAGYHAWNRVQLSDGTYKYYDACWNIRDEISSPHEECLVNCYIDCYDKW